MTITTVSSGQTITGQTVLNGDSIEVNSGGTASAMSILPGGGLTVDKGGAASAISDNGSFTVFSGANASATTIGAQGFESLLGNDSNVTVDGGGLIILAASPGLGATAGTVTATSGDAVRLTGGNVTNNGVITANLGNGINVNPGNATDNAYLSNSRSIVAGLSGIYITSGTADITNSGTITGSVSAITDVSTASSMPSITNSGVLNVSSDSGTAIALSSGGYVTNFGMINAGSGVAISGVTTLDIGTKSTTNGKVTASDTGFTILELSNSSNVYNPYNSGDGTTGTLSGIGSSFVGFKDVVLDAGANWTLSGTNQLSSSLTINVGGTLTVAPGALTASAGAGIGFNDITIPSEDPNPGNTVLAVSDNMGGIAIVGFPNTYEFGLSPGFSSTNEILLNNVAFDASTTVSVAGTLVTVSNGSGASDTLDIADGQGTTYHVASGADGATALYANAPPISTVSIDSRLESGSGGPGSTIAFRLSLPPSTTAADTTDGMPVLLLSDGGTATYQGLRPSIDPSVVGQVLEFTTTVTEGQNASDLTVTGINLNGAVFYGANGQPVDLSDVATLTGSDTHIAIDTTPPIAPSELVATSTFAVAEVTGHAVAGSTVTVTDTFGGTSTVIGVAPSSEDGTFLADIIPLANGVHVITATDTDSYGNVSAPSTAYTLTVDTVAPTITALAATPSTTGTLGVGGTITFDLTPSTRIGLRTSLLLATSTGSPTLTLSDGGTASYVAAQSTPTDLVFQTTVLAGQDTADLKVTGLALNGSLPADAGGNILSVAGIATLAGSDTGISIDTAPAVTPTPDPTPTPTPAPVPTTGVTSTAGASGGTVFTSVATGSSSVTASASGNDVINSLGSDTIQAGGGFDVVYASGPAATVSGGTGNLVFVAGSGAYTAGGGAGVDILYGGSGASALIGGGGKNSVIVAGTGNTSLVGGTGTAAVMFGGSAANTFVGSAGGADTMVGGTGSNTFSLTSGGIAFGGPNGPDIFNTGVSNSLIVEGTGTSQINVGTGVTTDFAGIGADTYAITQGSRAVANIIGFKTNDHITLTGGFTAADASSAVSTATTGSFGTTLNLSNGTKVNLFGVSITAAQVSVG